MAVEGYQWALLPGGGGYAGTEEKTVVEDAVSAPGIGVSYSPPDLDLMGATEDWWDLAGIGDIDPGRFQAPGVSAPLVEPPAIPGREHATPGHYGDRVQEPTSELESLINQIIGREPEPPPDLKVDEEWVNDMISQFGLEPRTSEEIRDAAQAITARQAFQKDQVIQREIDRFEREYPNEFRKAQGDILKHAQEMTADMQEEMGARGMFYSSIMAGATSHIDAQVMEQVNDIAVAAASRVAGLRDERRDVEEWRILEEELVYHQLEAEDRQMRQQLMHMHVEVATWADQMALDTWYKHENLKMQEDQVQLQAIQLRMQEAERLGQHYATAMMADHPLVQGTLRSMGISPSEFASMPMEAQSALVNQTVGFNEVEQRMRLQEFQMRATVAEIQLQNANMQLQASIASGQFQMEAMGLQLQAMMHKDQMALSWAGHALSVAGLEHQVGMDQAMLDLEQQKLGLQRWGMQQQYADQQAMEDPRVHWEAYQVGAGLWDSPSATQQAFLSSVDPYTASFVQQAWAEEKASRAEDTGSFWDFLQPTQPVDPDFGDLGRSL